MNKRDLATEILDHLLDNGMINLEYGQEFWREGKVECIKAITDRLSDYVIVQGRGD